MADAKSAPESPFIRARNAAFDELISGVQERIDAVRPSPLVITHGADASGAKPVAERDVWNLFFQGLRQLKQSPLAGKGVVLAFQKVSLRNAPLAAALLVPPPRFEQVFVDNASTDGRESAIVYSENLIAVAENDLPRSRDLICSQIDRILSLQAPPVASLAAAPPPRGTETLKDLSLVCEGALDQLETMVKSYAAACDTLKGDLARLKPQARKKYSFGPGSGGAAN